MFLMGKMYYLIIEYGTCGHDGGLENEFEVGQVGFFIYD